ncbi:hypothetical protein OIE66_13670 [Nonomuraea sp. NBC_01738]|uniref:hypothetical protein n=1 Tax=Nonomuraea sp. NBC_01738 TaxID=2976003 RepID=UPI002E0EE13E|nr:hypothetical protein OIE66_13670 [Nonomuraea sp. NBC_01738]
MSNDQLTTQTRKNVEKLLQFSGNVGGLTEDDVLAVLNEAGITTLESLVQRAVATPPPARPEPIDSFRLLSPAMPSAATGAVRLTHRPPQVAVIVDGVEYDPGDITRFDGQMLTFVADGSPDRILAYTDDRALCAAVWAASAIGRAEGRPVMRTRPSTIGEVQMFEHHYFAGDWFWLPANHGWPDLTEVKHGSWPGSEWNDTISSTGATDCLVFYYEHDHYNGSRLWGTPNIDIPDMERIGWNDRISSVANHGPIRT